MIPLVHLDRVLQVPPFQPHQPPQMKTHPARRNPNFWLQPLMPPLVHFRFQTHTASPLVHLDRFLPGPPFQPHQVPQKKAHSGWINPKFWLQPRMLSLLFVCFQNHLALDLLHVFQLDFFLLSVPFLQLCLREGHFTAILWHKLSAGRVQG